MAPLEIEIPAGYTVHQVDNNGRSTAVVANRARVESGSLIRLAVMAGIGLLADQRVKYVTVQADMRPGGKVGGIQVNRGHKEEVGGVIFRGI